MKRARALLHRVWDFLVGRNSASVFLRQFCEPLEQRRLLSGSIGSDWDSDGVPSAVAGQAVDTEEIWAISDNTETVTANWGDGSTPDTFSSTTTEDAEQFGANTAEFLHTYSLSGDYTLTLSMPGADSKTYNLPVGDALSTETLTADGPADIGDPITIRLSAPPDGDLNHYGVGNISADRPYVAAGYPIYNGDGTAEIAFTQRGQYQVQGYAAVSGYNGWEDNTTDPISTEVDVGNIAPYASIASTNNEDGTVTVSLVNPNDSAADVAAGLHYSFAENPDDLATSYAAAQSGNSKDFSFTASGDHSIWGRVFDQDGAYRDYNTTVIVPDLAVFSPSDSQVDLTWSDVTPQAPKYRIERSSDGQNFTILQTLNRDQLNFDEDGNINWSDTGLSEGTRYWYRVRAVDDSGGGNDTAYSPKRSVYVELKTPTDLTAVAKADGTIDLSWTDHSSLEAGYKVAWLQKVDGGYVGGPVITPVGDVTDYSVSGLTPGNTYGFTVFAYNVHTSSNITDFVDATAILLPPPSDLAASNVTTDGLTLNWTGNSNNATGYVIERAVGDGDFESDPSWTTDADTTSFTFNDLALGTTYRFKVQAKNGPLQSDSSEVFSTKTILPPPSDVIASNVGNDTNDIALSWENGADNYDHVILRRYALVDGVMGSTPIDTITLDGSATNYTFTNNADGETDEFTVQGSRNSMDDGGGISPDDSGGGDDSSDDDTTSTPTAPVQNFTEPTDTWTYVYDSDTFDVVPYQPYVHATLSPTPDSESDGFSSDQATTTLTLTGLPRHTYARVYGTLWAHYSGETEVQPDSIQFSAQAGGQDLPITSTPAATDDWAAADGVWGFGIGGRLEQTNEAYRGETDAFKDDKGTMKITFGVEGLPTGWHWGATQIWVETYMPFVSLSTQYGKEGGPDATVTVARTTESNTISGTPLDVKVKDLGGTATKGQDYTFKGSSITVPGYTDGTPNHDGQSYAQPLGIVDDGTAEWTENTSFQLQKSPDYEISTLDPQKVEIVDNDIDITGLPKIMQVNNNDDDGNGNPDLNDTGMNGNPSYTGASDPDLHELDLKFPAEQKTGATVTLSSSGGIQFWLNQNHTGFLGGGKTWVVGQDEIPQKVYVEAISGSSNVDDVLVTLADDDSSATVNPPDHATKNSTPTTTGPASSPYRATNVGIRILSLNGNIAQPDQEPTGHTQNWLIGQLADLLVSIDAPAIWVEQPSYSWNIPGRTLLDYQPNSTQPIEVPLAAHTWTGSVDALGNPIDIGTSERQVEFFWTSVDTSSPENQKVTIQVSNIGGHSYTAETTFKLYAPSVTAEVATDHVVLSNSPSGFVLMAGLGRANGGKEALELSASVSVPQVFTSQGTWTFLQTVTTNEQIHSNGKSYSNPHNGSKVLDYSFPVPSTNILKSDGTGAGTNSLETGSGQFTFFDTPYDTLSTDHAVYNTGAGTSSATQIDGETRNDSYDTYIMFLAPGNNSRWVAIKKTTWHWAASASVVAHNPDGSFVWALNSHQDPTASSLITPTAPPIDWLGVFQEEWREQTGP
jgi:Fibronectin type III domain